MSEATRCTCDCAQCANLRALAEDPVYLAAWQRLVELHQAMVDDGFFSPSQSVFQDSPEHQTVSQSA